MDNTDKTLWQANQAQQYFGSLQVQVVCEAGSRPIDTCTVNVYNKDAPDTLIDTLSTNISGLTRVINLPAPPLEYSMEPPGPRPYSEYLLFASAPGLTTVLIDGVQILPNTFSLQKIILPRLDNTQDTTRVITIAPHLLYGNYPLRVYEPDVKEVPGAQNPPNIQIPEYLIVHNGIPSDETAVDYYVEYRDYIKNVVSSISYANWTNDTLYALILSTLSFSLNRYYTNWYQRQGYPFHITTSTAYDQLWIYGRNIYGNVSVAVDYMFNLFLARPGILQPILTQACRGTITDCPRMLSIWGAKLLGDTGYDAKYILHFYYGDDLYISYTNNFSNLMFPWQGMDLSSGAAGGNVSGLQKMLDLISKAYIAIPVLEDNGIYDPITEKAVKTYQEIFFLPVTGIVNLATWYSISRLYNRLSHADPLCCITKEEII